MGRDRNVCFVGRKQIQGTADAHMHSRVTNTLISYPYTRGQHRQQQKYFVSRKQKSQDVQKYFLTEKSACMVPRTHEVLRVNKTLLLRIIAFEPFLR